MWSLPPWKTSIRKRPTVRHDEHECDDDKEEDEDGDDEYDGGGDSGGGHSLTMSELRSIAFSV